MVIRKPSSRRTKVVPVSFKGFVLVLPHAEAVVGLRQPVFEIVYNDFVRRIISRDALENDLAFSIVQLGVSLASFRIHLPQESLGIYVGVLPLDGE